MQNLGRLELNRTGLYSIEVNDKGDYIVIDTEDIEFPLRLQKMYDDCDKIAKNVKLQSKVIDKKETVSKGIITNKDEDYTKLFRKAFNDIRKAIDTVLGDGACQKIFGDTNYFNMVDDLMAALSPHLEKIGVIESDIRKSIEAKYADKEEDTI